MNVIAHNVVDGVVVNTANFANEEVPLSWGWVIQDGAEIGWVVDEETGKLVPPPEPEKPPRTLEDVYAEVTAHIEGLIRDKCAEFRFNSLERAAIYINSPYIRQREPAFAIVRWTCHMYNYVRELENQLSIDDIINYDMDTLKADLPSWDTATHTPPAE